VLGATTGTEAGIGQAGSKPYTWVLCKPSVNVDRWGVLAITGIEIAPTATATDAETKRFEEQPIVTGGTPSATTTAWCVAVEPIDSGKVGRVAVAGVVQLKAADLDKAAGAEVLWKDSSWALIRLQSGVVRGTFTAPWNKGVTKTVTDAVSSGTTYADVKNYFANVSGSGSKNCAIAYVGTEWILIAAECG
jgi:predicted RecA/RadA family phage recombinase